MKVRVVRFEIRNVAAPCCFMLTPLIYVHQDPALIAIGFKWLTFGWALEAHHEIRDL